MNEKNALSEFNKVMNSGACVTICTKTFEDSFVGSIIWHDTSFIALRINGTIRVLPKHDIASVEYKEGEKH